MIQKLDQRKNNNSNLEYCLPYSCNFVNFPTNLDKFLTPNGDDPLKKISWLLLLTAICTFNIFPQVTAKIMTYNILNYPGSTGPQRNPLFRTVISSVDPDILVVGELGSTANFETFRDSVMKKISTDYNAGTFIDGPDTDHGIFFKSSKFTFLSNTPIPTELRDISQFIVVANMTHDTLIIYAVHLKSSTGSANEAQRAREVDSLRKVTDRLHAAANFIVLGDFNMYKSTEAAYGKLTNQSLPGYFKDPLDMPGNWQDNPAYAQYHTQSPRTRQFEGGATGGMDDRFDMILMSQTVWDLGGVYYVPGSYVAYGNDGLHLNDSINRPPNNAVGQTIADALHYASDHIPVFASFTFSTPVPVELVSFSGTRVNGGIELNWQTATETNNYGFDVERSASGDDWTRAGFVEGHNTTTLPQFYGFVDRNASSGTRYYRLKQIDNDGTSSFSKVIEISENLPSGFKLEKNYPNPFNPSTKISFELPASGHVTLRVYDVTGNEVALLTNGTLEAGRHVVEFSPSGLAAGNYVYRLSCNGFSLSGKMLYLP